MQNLHLDSLDLAHQMSSTLHRSPIISSGSNTFTLVYFILFGETKMRKIVARAVLLSSGQAMLTPRELATMGGWVMGEASSSGIPS